MGTIDFFAFDVDQGLGTFTVCYNDNGVPIHTMLYDLGSTSSNTAAKTAAVNTVVARLKAMATPTIDLLLISHTDADHHNLIWNVLWEFDPPPARPGRRELVIRKAIHGGHPGNFTTTIVTEIAKFTPSKKVLYATDYKSDFLFRKNPAVITPMDAFGGLSVYMIMGNVRDMYAPNHPVGGGQTGDDGVLKNTVSLVVLLVANGVGIVLTGDATGLTLAACNHAVWEGISQNMFNNVVVATVPHHGSATTAFELRGLQGVDATENVRRFAANIRARSIVASSGDHQGFLHPSQSVLKLFWTQLATNPMWSDPQLPFVHRYTAYLTAHSYTAYVDRRGTNPAVETVPHQTGYHAMFSQHNVYTTMYARTGADHRWERWRLPPEPIKDIAEPWGIPAAPPKGATWLYRIAPNGQVELIRQGNQARRTDDVLARLAIPPAPPPSISRPVGRSTARALRVFP